MIPLTDSLSWLNREDPSHLTNKSRFTLWQINDAKVPDSKKEGMIDTLVTSARAGQDACEYGEVLVLCGKVQVERRQLAEGKRYLQLAHRVYANIPDPFRKAVAAWMLSTVLWMLSENIQAHSAAREARSIFEKIEREKKQELNDKGRNQEKLEERVRWFGETIARMNENLAATPEEAYECLNQFEESHLSAAMKQLRDAMFAATRDKDFYRANSLVTRMQEISRSSLSALEKAEALALCSLIQHQMGNGKEALRLIRLSCSLYPQESHQWSYARWMQGMIQAKDPAGFYEAMAACEASIDAVEGLKLLADRKNQSAKRDWYGNQANILRAVVKRSMARA